MTPTANHLASLVLRLNELWNERASAERIADQLGHCRVIAEHIIRGYGGAPGATDVERAEWVADKIVALGDYAWIDWTGDGSPAFEESDMVSVRTRGGRETGFELRPWEFRGWNHTGGENDIVQYRTNRSNAGVQEARDDR